MLFNSIERKALQELANEHGYYDIPEQEDTEEEREEKPVAYCDMCGIYFLAAGDKCPKCGEVDPDVFYHLGEADLADYYENGGVLYGTR